MDSSVNIPSNNVPVLNINITKHSSSISKASSSKLLILSVDKNDNYNCILASAIHSYLSRSLVSFNQRFATNAIIKNKQEEFAAQQAQRQAQQ
jgi:hypothetical protein